LIELLIVIVIIGVLFAVALPVFENVGRKDTNRAAQQVMNTLRLARQHAVAKRQWTFVIFPNRDGTYVSGSKGLNTLDKCLQSYAVVAATNNLDGYRMYKEDATGPTIDDMDLEFVSDWKYLQEGIYFDDDGTRKNNYMFGYHPNRPYYNPGAAGDFKFPLDPAHPEIKDQIMSAVVFKPNGRMFTMAQGGTKHWIDIKHARLYLVSDKYYEPLGNTLGDPQVIPGTNTTLQFQAKTGMVKIYEEDD